VRRVLLLLLFGCTRADPPSPTSASVSASATAPPESKASTPPPDPRACLARYYGSLDEFPWDDGKRKTMSEKLESPDLEDMLSLPYPRGAITRITDPDHDPGRVRFEPLFRAVYGKTPAEVSASLVPVEIRGRKVSFHSRAAPALRRVAERIAKLDASFDKYFASPGGTFNARPIAGTDRASAHSWGIAMDIDVSFSDYWRNDGANVVWKNRVPQEIVDAFEAEGFVWGGRWYHYDTMHFEWRPEMFDAACATKRE
jgi:hypothetical protein